MTRFHIAVLYGLGVILIAYAFTVWYLAPIEINVTYIDPFAGDVADFRRQLHDWDRDGK